MLHNLRYACLPMFCLFNELFVLFPCIHLPCTTISLAKLGMHCIHTYLQSCSWSWLDGWFTSTIYSWSHLLPMNFCRLTVVNLGILILLFWGLVKRIWMMTASWDVFQIHPGQFLRSLPLLQLRVYIGRKSLNIHLTVPCLFLTYAFLMCDSPTMPSIILMFPKGVGNYNLFSDH